MDHPVRLQANSARSSHSWGYGWVDPGKWPPGRYTVKIFEGTREILSSAFTVHTDLEAADLLFNWLEALFPQILSPGASTASPFSDLHYRYYTKTNVFLGTVEGDLYFLDERGELHNLGRVNYWLAHMGSQEPGISNLLQNPDPMNPLISRIEFTTNGNNQIEAVEFYGRKSNGSSVADSALLYYTGIDGATVMQFDEEGRPNQIYLPDGTQFEINVNNGNVRLSYVRTDESFGVVEFTLDDELKDLWDGAGHSYTPAAKQAREPVHNKTSAEGYLPSSPLTLKPNFRTSNTTVKMRLSQTFWMRIEVEDKHRTNLGPVLVKPGVECDRFDCKVIELTYGRGRTLFDNQDHWGLNILIEISREVDLPYDELYTGVVLCADDRDAESRAIASTSLGLGIISAALTYCAFSNPLTAITAAIAGGGIGFL